jgi:hypothetical protein
VPNRPPPAAARSVLVEVLLAEFAAALPEPFAARVRAANNPGTAMDWMFAGAVYRAAAYDPYLAAQFLARIDADPRAAGLAMTKALASKQEPPLRDAAWHRRDWAGLILQLSAAAIIFFAGRLLLILIASLINPFMAKTTLTSIRANWVGPDLLPDLRAIELIVSILLTIAVLWLSLELVVVPRLLELLRQLPARWRGFSPPLAWRIDAFYVLWCAQSMVALLLVEAVVFRTLAQRLIEPVSCRWAESSLAVVAFIGVIAIGLAVSQVRPVVRLGTQGPGQNEA